MRTARFWRLPIWQQPWSLQAYTALKTLINFRSVAIRGPKCLAAQNIPYKGTKEIQEMLPGFVGHLFSFFFALQSFSTVPVPNVGVVNVLCGALITVQLRVFAKQKRLWSTIRICLLKKYSIDLLKIVRYCTFPKNMASTLSASWNAQTPRRTHAYENRRPVSGGACE